MRIARRDGDFDRVRGLFLDPGRKENQSADDDDQDDDKRKDARHRRGFCRDEKPLYSFFH